MKNCKSSIDTPFTRGEYASKTMGLKTPKEKKKWLIPYSNAFESLIYTTMGTRPNACYTIRMVSRCQENLGRMHWRFVKKIPR